VRSHRSLSDIAARQKDVRRTRNFRAGRWIGDNVPVTSVTTDFFIQHRKGRRNRLEGVHRTVWANQVRVQDRKVADIRSNIENGVAAPNQL
jgi:hypothetical protein